MGLIVVALAVGTALVIGLSLAPLGISRRAASSSSSPRRSRW